MGAEIPDVTFTDDDYRRFDDRLLTQLSMLDHDFSAGRFDADKRRIGMELEIVVINQQGFPVPDNARLLERMADSNFTHELSRFNIELNTPPVELKGTAFSEMDFLLRRSMYRALEIAREMDLDLSIIGILPTLDRDLLTLDYMSNAPRYRILNQALMKIKGEPFKIDITGVDPNERLLTETEDMMLESANTSAQIHLQLSPSEFPRYHRASKLAAAFQLAVAGNSPFLMGRALWNETRIALFKQSMDVRREALRSQHLKSRVTFGRQFYNSALDIFAENRAEYQVLLPIVSNRPDFEPYYETVLHNGTVWRWNRPVIGWNPDRPNFRIENRLLPAGPTIVDSVANAAFFAGLVTELVHGDVPAMDVLSFANSKYNFYRCAEFGLRTNVYWPGPRRDENTQSLVTEVILDEISPLARAGLQRLEVSQMDIDRFIGIIELRCRKEMTGSRWLRLRCRRWEEFYPRRESIRRSFMEYCRMQKSHLPVHEWPHPEELELPVSTSTRA